VFAPQEYVETRELVVELLKQLIKKVHSIRTLFDHPYRDLQQLELFVPPGHYFSPIPSIPEIRLQENELWPSERNLRTLGGIDWNEENQLKLLETFKKYYKDLPFEAQKARRLRYFYRNPSYSYSDAIFLYCFIRHLKPKRIIEVGSGYSSCLMIDTNEIHFQGSIALTCIEPYPKLLKSLISKRDCDTIQIIDKRLQDVDMSLFQQLSPGDILFIDSTHVSKIGSDVNQVFFNILPALKDGVFVHFHDIFCDFEYLREWVYKGVAWNEAYLLRAFLQWNWQFQIAFCNTYLESLYEPEFTLHFPLCLINTGGSIWLEKKCHLPSFE
jgi:predicted O-methyltransferase YrrM